MKREVLQLEASSQRGGDFANEQHVNIFDLGMYDFAEGVDEGERAPLGERKPQRQFHDGIDRQRLVNARQ